MKLFKYCSSLFTSTLLLSAPVFAGGVDEVVFVAPESYNWTGYYAGLNAGIVKHAMNITDIEATSFNATIEQVSNPKFMGGLQVGYRHQWDLSAAAGVFGVELSANFANAKANQEYGSSFALYQFDAEKKLNSVYLAQLMGGIAADRTLLFVTAGFSWSIIKGNVTSLNGAPFFDSFSLKKNAFGTTIGGGLEYAFCDVLSARFQVDVITPRIYSTHDDNDAEFQISNNIVRGTFGINYKFG